MNAPRCVFCGRSDGVQFAMFNPRFKPFGTACVECEAEAPSGSGRLLAPLAITRSVKAEPNAEARVSMIKAAVKTADIAKVRVAAKRVLRLVGVPFNNEATDAELATLLRLVMERITP